MKSYLVKVYDPSDNYLTTWEKDVISQINFNNEINSAGSELVITLARNAGDYGEGSDIDFNYRIKVYCIDKEQPSGLLIFQGYISSYTPIYKDNNVLVTVLGYGSELEKYMLQLPIDEDNSILVEGNGFVTGRKSSNSYLPLNTIGGDTAGAGDWFTTGVKFTTLSGMTAIPQIDVTLHYSGTYDNPTDLTLKSDLILDLYPLLTSGARSGYPDYDNSLGTVTLPAGTTPTKDLAYTATNYDTYFAKPVVYTFVFDSPVAVSSSTSYVFVVKSPTGSIFTDPLSGYTIGDTWAEWYYDTTSTLLDSYPASNYEYEVRFSGGDPTNNTNFNGQSFNPSATKQLNQATFYMRRDASATGTIYAYLYAHTGVYGAWNGWGTPLYGNYLAKSDPLPVSSIGTSLGLVTFTFSGINAYAMTANTKYVVGVDPTGSQGDKLYMGSRFHSNTHAGASIGHYTDTSTEEYSYQNGWFAGYPGGITEDLMFYVYGKDFNTTAVSYNRYKRSGTTTEAYSTGKVIPFSIYQLEGKTTVPYLSQEPASILKDVINKYRWLGGTLNYDNNSIDLTGTTVSYTFNTSTILEAINKIVELCPENWYWYIDQSTNLVHLHQKNTSVDHTFSLEKDLADARFEKRIEDLTNTIYFTGGGTPPLYKKFQELNSVSKYGVKAIKYSDNRVKDINTAQTIANAILSTKSQPELRVELEVIDSNNNQSLGYDIETVKVGDVVAVRNVSQQVGLSSWDIGRFDEAYWDYNIQNLSSIQMQIQRLSYKEDTITIQASTLAVDVNKRIEDINRNLEALQTLNNGETPS